MTRAHRSREWIARLLTDWRHDVSPSRRPLPNEEGAGSRVHGSLDASDAVAAAVALPLELGDAPSGTYPAPTVPADALTALPCALDGSLTVNRWGEVGSVAHFITSPPVQREFRNLRLDGSWMGWTEDGTAQDGKRRLRTPVETLRTTPLALTTGYGGGRTSGSGTTTLVQHLHPAARRIQLRLRNWNPRYSYADRPPVALTSVRVGRHLGKGRGTEWTDLPNGRTEYGSGWFEVPPTLRGAEIVVQYSWNGREVMRCLGTGWTEGTRDKFPPLFAWLELETPAAVPVVGVLGSSTAAGVGSARPLVDAWLHRWARAHGAIPAFWTASGDSASSWTAAAHRKWEPYGTDVSAPDLLLQALGANDWASGASLEDLQERLARTTFEARERLSTIILGTTITPRRVRSDRDTVRLEINDWMPDSGLFEDVLDLAAAVALPDGTLDPEVDADGIHVNDLGHERLAAAIDPAVLRSHLRV